MALATIIPQPPQNEAPLDDSGQHSQAWSQYFQKMSNILQTTSGLRHGVTDGSDATPGDIGEYMALTGASIGLSSGATANLVTLNLTAGDWDVSGYVAFTTAAGGHPTNYLWGIGGLDTQLMATFATAAQAIAQWTGPKRVSIAATTGVTLQAAASFTGGMTAQGTLQARRAR